MHAVAPCTHTSGRRAAPAAPAMTACACAGLEFEEIVARCGSGLPLAEIASRTGCGDTCTACLPDLAAFLAEARRRASR